MGKTSIIIGLYNVADFLEAKKLSCILNQTYRNLEIILVNDGSTDRTRSICEELAAQDSRIVLINKENGGLGSARNTGLEAATGDYIWFYDVDDEAELNLIEKNVSWMQEYQTDMNIFGYQCITPHLRSEMPITFRRRLVRTNRELKEHFVDELLFVPNGNGFAWNKFYRRAFIERHHIRFGNQRIQQDEVFNLRFYPKIDHLYVSDERLYRYYIYNTGNTRSRFIKDRFEIYLSIFENLLQFSRIWELEDKRFERYSYQRFYGGIENAVLFNAFHQGSGYTPKERKAEIHKILEHPQAKACIRYIQANIPLSFEQRLYRHAFACQSYREIVFLKKLFQTLRKIKRNFLKTFRQA